MTRLAYTETIQNNLAFFICDEFQHQIRVLRHRIGDQIEFIDGRGGHYKGKITTIDDRKKWFQVEIDESEIIQPQAPLNLIVALPKGGKLDNIIQKAIELGVTRITPIITSRTNVRLNSVNKKNISRKEHWQRIAIASLKQSRNHYLPEIHLPEDILHLDLNFVNDTSEKRLVFHPAAESSLSTNKLNFTQTCATIVALGPEGGFDESEITLLCNSGFTPISLGKRILRLETAVVSALTLIQHLRQSL